ALGARDPRCRLPFPKNRSSTTWQLCPADNPNQLTAKYGEREVRPSGERQPSSVATAKDQRGVGPSESEGIRQHGVDRPPPRLIRHEVDRRGNRRVVEIERRGGQIVANGEGRKDRFDG